MGNRGTSKNYFSPQLFQFYLCDCNCNLARKMIRRTTFRDALKGDEPKGTNANLRFPAGFCSFLRKSAVFCENLRFPNALFSKKRRESAKISENLRLGSVCPLRFVPLSAPWIFVVCNVFVDDGTQRSEHSYFGIFQESSSQHLCPPPPRIPPPPSILSKEKPPLPPARTLPSFSPPPTETKI